MYDYRRLIILSVVLNNAGSKAQVPLESGLVGIKGLSMAKAFKMSVLMTNVRFSVRAFTFVIYIYML